MEEQVPQEPSQFENVDFSSSSDGPKENNIGSEKHENGESEQQTQQTNGKDSTEEQVFYAKIKLCVYKFFRLHKL